MVTGLHWCLTQTPMVVGILINDPFRGIVSLHTINSSTLTPIHIRQKIFHTVKKEVRVFQLYLQLEYHLPLYNICYA